MRVMVVVGGWPAPGNPQGIFVKAQVDALTAIGVAIDVFVIRGAGWRKYLRAAIGMPRRARGGYDVVHAHYGHSGWVARCQRSCPVVVSFLGDDLLGSAMADGSRARSSLWIAAANRRLAERVDAVIVKSKRMAGVLPPCAVSVIPNGVDLARFRPVPREEACATLGLDPALRYVLFPADPQRPGKNLPLARLAVEHARRATDRPLEMLTFGQVSPDRVPAYYNAASAVLFTSFSEGSPNVIKEALACEAPVVSVPVGDVPEQLDGIEACEVGPYDAARLGAALARLVQAGRRSNGRQVLEARGLDSASVARRVLSVYEQVVAASSKTGRGGRPA